MIFISYRHGDSDATVTHLHRRLVEHFGRDRVFIDYEDIPAGEKWESFLRQALEKRGVVLAVIGPAWGDARFSSGKKKGRLRLDDPDDWVRQEICAAMNHQDRLGLVVVMVDGATLPETQWDCQLDQMGDFQHARLHSLRDFEADIARLCRDVEILLPPCKQDSPHHEIMRYLAAELRHHANIQLPLVDDSGRSIIAPMNDLHIDLPLIISHRHGPKAEAESVFSWYGKEPHDIQDDLRRTHTNALLIDREPNVKELPRDFDITKAADPQSRLVITGDPGCGKSTLLQSIAYRHGIDFMQAADPTSFQGCVPVLILCRDLARHPPPSRFSELLSQHLVLRQFSDKVVSVLVPCLESLFESGRLILLIDGLDEIPDLQHRLDFCRLLHLIANRFPRSSILVTSRVVGFQAVSMELRAEYDHLLVGPLDRLAKQEFLERWSRLIQWDEAKTGRLIHHACKDRVVAKLTDNIFLLAMIVQIYMLDDRLPQRRVDVYRRAVQLMISRRRPFSGVPLTTNEVMSHVEFLAYRMRLQGVQNCSEAAAVAAFDELRQLEPNEPVLRTRASEVLLQACIDSIGILNVAGTETDFRGFDRRVVQFFHQSFQEYFAGQAIKHGYGSDARSQHVTTRLHDLLNKIEIREREVMLWGEYTIVEPVLADYWQEAVRMAIADLDSGDADHALLLLLPDTTTSPREARPRAIFALQCLIDEPNVSQGSMAAVFDAVVDNLSADDGFGTQARTWMDEVLSAAMRSPLGSALINRMLREFIASRGDTRNQVGGCISALMNGAAVVLDNADSVIDAAVQALDSENKVERVQGALGLLNSFFNSHGKLGFLVQSQRDRVIDAMLQAASRDEATECAVMWALVWLTNAKYNARTGAVADDVLLLDVQSISRVENIVRRADRDANTLAYGCLVLTREQGIDIVMNQRDWIYDLALVADGVNARRTIARPRVVRRGSGTAWMRRLLFTSRSLRCNARISQALGAFGVYVPEMIPGLRDIFLSKKFTNNERDEALVYLALIGTSVVIDLLVQAADTPPVGQDDYLYSRGLFGLLLTDDVDALAAQLCKVSAHSDLNAYAYGLAGSTDPRGLLLLQDLGQRHPDEKVRAAALNAVSRTWVNIAK